MRELLLQMFGTTDGKQLLVMLLTRVFIVLTILPVHEFAHAFIAKKLGDDTAERMGRLTLNPLRHLHWIGSAMLILFGFGFAKPVPVNPYRFRNQERRRLGMALTAIAGSASNLIMAFAAATLFCVCACISDTTYYLLISLPDGLDISRYTDAWSYIGMFFAQFSIINISLAVFNLLPVPPLDGSRIFGLLFPERIMMLLEKYSFIFIIVIFVVINRVSGVGNALGSITTTVFVWFHNLITWIFNLFGASLTTLGV